MENGKYCLSSCPSWYHKMNRVCKHQILAVNIVGFCCVVYKKWICGYVDMCLNKAQEFGPLDAALFFGSFWLSSRQRLSHRCWFCVRADWNLTSSPTLVQTLSFSVTQTLPSHRSICITVATLSLHHFSWQVRSYIHRLCARNTVHEWVFNMLADRCTGIGHNMLM